MITITPEQVKRMSPQERLAHYESEKKELLFHARNIPVDELSEAQAYLSRKWMV